MLSRLEQSSKALELCIEKLAARDENGDIARKLRGVLACERDVLRLASIQLPSPRPPPKSPLRTSGVSPAHLGVKLSVSHGEYRKLMRKCQAAEMELSNLKRSLDLKSAKKRSKQSGQKCRSKESRGRGIELDSGWPACPLLCFFPRALGLLAAEGGNDTHPLLPFQPQPS